MSTNAVASITARAEPAKTATPLVISSFPFNPLTTTFTATDPYCSGIYQSNILVIDHQPPCYPSGYPTSDTSFFYSPGIACPSGYWTACHDNSGVKSISTVICCPVRGDITMSCRPRNPPPSEVWATMGCTWEAPVSPGTVLVITGSEDGRTSTVKQTVMANGGINAFGIRMVYQATDLPESTTTPATSDPTAPLTTTGTGAGAGGGAAGVGDGNSGSDSSSGGLSTGATVAIAVVVPVVVLGAIIAGLVIWWRKRKRRALQSPGAAAAVTPAWAAPGSQAKPPGGYYYYGNEMPADQQMLPQEMPGGGWHHHTEMPTNQPAVELSGIPTANPSVGQGGTPGHGAGQGWNQ